MDICAVTLVMPLSRSHRCVLDMRGAIIVTRARAIESSQLTRLTPGVGGQPPASGGTARSVTGACPTRSRADRRIGREMSRRLAAVLADFAARDRHLGSASDGDDERTLCDERWGLRLPAARSELCPSGRIEPYLGCDRQSHARLTGVYSGGLIPASLSVRRWGSSPMVPYVGTPAAS
jgi:hypothetical protein